MPLYVRVPGATGPQTREQMVINNDMAPTLADLAGAEISSNFTVDGRSFAPLLEDGGEPTWGRKRFMGANDVVRDG